MKFLKYAFLLLLAGSFFTSCQKDCCDFGEVIVEPNDSIALRGTATLGGVVNCINGEPKEGIFVTITDTDGNVWNEITNASGQFQLNDMPNVEYTIEFDYTDVDATAYTVAEAQQILSEMYDFILGINSDFQLIDALVYDANDNGSLSTLDYVLFEKRYIEMNPSTLHPIWDWRFIAVEESQTVTSNSFSYPSNLTIQLYQPNATADLEYIAVRVGDRHGFACDSAPPVVTGPLSGVVNCINGEPKVDVTVNISGSDGSSFQEITDAEGKFELVNEPNVRYTFELAHSDNDADAYTEAEAQQILGDMRDYILNINSNVQLIDQLVYDVNNSGTVTSLDIVEFEKRYIEKVVISPNPMWEWKFVGISGSPIVNSNSIFYPPNESINGYNPNMTADLEFIAMRAGDRRGVTCDNTPPVITSPLSGVVNCINGDPKEGVTVNISGSDGSNWQEVTDVDGKFQLDNLPNVQYTFDLSYSDDDATAYSDAEAQQILDDMMDIILNVNQNTQLIDQLVYDVNDSGAITTLDHVLFEKRYIDKEVVTPNPMWEWRYVEISGSPIVDANSIYYPPNESINGYNPVTTGDLEFVIIRAADRIGVACDN